MNLSGQLLIAMPGMGDPRFEQSVVFLCAHSEDAAMGLIINKPAPELDFKELLVQLDIDAGPRPKKVPIHVGGPVETGRGFVLHSTDYGPSESTLDVTDQFAMTATMDILSDIAHGNGPHEALLALGYAGWGPGQLENEIKRNGWLTADAAKDLVFAPNDDDKWQDALKALGVDVSVLSADAGRA